jgi:hypothetical protein
MDSEWGGMASCGRLSTHPFWYIGTPWVRPGYPARNSNRSKLKVTRMSSAGCFRIGR